MRIVLIAKSFTKGGAASGARNLRDSLESVGHDVICLDGYATQEENRSTRFFRVIERIIERIFLDHETHFLKLWPSTIDLREVEKEFKPDVIQICDISGNTIDFMHVRHLTCPIIHRMSDFWPYKGSAHYYSERNLLRKMADWLHRKYIFDDSSWPTIRIAPSQWLADNVPNTPPASPVAYIPNAVRSNNRSKKKLTREPKTLNFGFISNQVLDPRKGFERLTKKLEHAANEGYDIKLNVFGKINARDRKTYKNINVLYHGQFKPSEISNVYGTFDILLCPSYLDNSPNVLSEALAHGLPAIGQVGTGMASYIHSSFGGMVDFDDSSQESILCFLELVNNLLDDYENASESAYSFVEKDLAYAVIGRRYTDIYNNLCN